MMKDQVLMMKMERFCTEKDLAITKAKLKVLEEGSRTSSLASKEEKRLTRLPEDTQKSERYLAAATEVAVKEDIMAASTQRHAYFTDKFEYLAFHK